MAWDVRAVFLIGVASYVFSRYYLEKRYKKEELYLVYALLSALLGFLSAYTVAADHPSRSYYIPLTAISIVLAIIYHQPDVKTPLASG